MRRLSILTLFVAVVTLAMQAQENTFNLVVEMENGTKITIGPNDLGSITFSNGEPVIVGTLSLQEWIASLAKLQDIEQLRDELHALTVNVQNENNQFFVPLAEYFDQSYWDRKEIGEALVALLEQIRSLAKNNQDDSMVLEERHAIDVAEIRALLNDCTNRIEALEAAVVEDDPAIIAGLCPDSNHPHLIDLGLPNGTLWSCCNVGASSPDGYGGYYAWGETEEKDYYTWDNYLHCDGSLATLHDIGSEISGTQYDVAHVAWAEAWQMPTEIQLNELRDNCTSEWTQINGINGRKFIGPNNNCIFLPAAGNWGFSTLNKKDENGIYISGTLDTDDSGYAQGLYFSDGYISMYGWKGGLFYGYSVRPVQKAQDNDHSLCPDDNHPHMIDLGLPSGVKWACCNVDATSPEGYGGYYAWGETEEKSSYTQGNYAHYSDFCEDVTDVIGTHNISRTIYDVAYVKWGTSWSMPTNHEQFELMENCSHEWTQVNGVNGMIITGSNGNSIFMPATGSYWSDQLYNEGSSGCYWSGDAYGVYYAACGLQLYDNNDYMEDAFNSYCGYSVRPVYVENPTDYPDLKISLQSLEIENGDSAELLVFSGSGSYAVSVDNEEVATVELTGYLIKVTAISVGTGTITVTDTKSGQVVTLPLTVTEKGNQVTLCPDDNHPHIIDLGVAGKWACCNVGATKPEECGGYFAWGETKEKNYYDYTTYSLYNVINDNADISGTVYDAATANWGTPWIMPSLKQVMKLVDNCTEEWVQVNGVNGTKFTGSNGNSIFLPAAGVQMEETLQEENEMGYYWSSTNHKFLPYGLEFDDYGLEGFLSGHMEAECGLSVRPMVFEPEVSVGEAIDLGLPSGTKWASCNIGASKPEEYGNYYAWGETEVKEYYDWSNYTLCEGSEGTCYDIGNEISGTLYDVAHVKWGGAWQMPTHTQCQELIDNCTIEWVEQNDGSYIIKYIGPNGNSILLPLAGYCSVGVYTEMDAHDPYWDDGTWGEYWSGSLVTSDNNLAETLWAYDGMGNSSRCIGRTVRPVRK